MFYQLCQQCSGYCFVVGSDFEQGICIDLCIGGVVVWFFGMFVDELVLIDYGYCYVGYVLLMGLVVYWVEYCCCWVGVGGRGVFCYQQV